MFSTPCPNHNISNNSSNYTIIDIFFLREYNIHTRSIRATSAAKSRYYLFTALVTSYLISMKLVFAFNLLLGQILQSCYDNNNNNAIKISLL